MRNWLILKSIKLWYFRKINKIEAHAADFRHCKRFRARHCQAWLSYILIYEARYLPSCFHYMAHFSYDARSWWMIVCATIRHLHNITGYAKYRALSLNDICLQKIKLPFLQHRRILKYTYWAIDNSAQMPSLWAADWRDFWNTDIPISSGFLWCIAVAGFASPPI